ncbi:MAG: DNA polymerase [Bdellovibrionota bacterium]
MAISFLYLDLNSFFASCEQQENPELRGRPVAVISTLAENTSVIAASYEAKKFGIKTGTKVYEARKMCPDIIFVAGNHRIYIEYHHKIIDAVDSCVPIHSVCSIDEIACELKGSQKITENAVALAEKIKKALRERVGEFMKGSIGIGPNILLAKMAADMKKPDGLTIVDSQDLPQRLFGLKLQDVPGIGYKMNQRLNERGVHTMERLLTSSVAEMRSLWGGVLGERYYRLFRGEQIEMTKSEQKSIGHSHVMPPKQRSHEGSKIVAMKLIYKTANRLRKAGFMAREMSVSIKCIGVSYELPTRYEKSFKFNETQDTSHFIGLIEDFFTQIPVSVKPLKASVVLSNFIHEAEHQLNFFDNDKKNHLFKIVDRINEKYGKNAVYPSSLLKEMKSAPTRIAFTRIPELDEI